MKKFLLGILVVHFLALWLFKDGFLLSRTVVNKPDNGTGAALSLFERTVETRIHKILESSKNTREKVLILLIDALRFDFAAKQDLDSSQVPKAFQNNLKIIHEKLEKEPANSHLFHFIADPPTTTMQRLKALMTGSLPTFIDAGSNFASGKVMDDNLPRQLRQAGLDMIFMGDDTWLSLYEKSVFKATFPYPSFEVYDLHTVDNGCLKNIVDFVALNSSISIDTSWSMLVAHFLGVDHVGHRYFADHPEMRNKLVQINEFLGRLLDSIDDETTVLMFGDHGMDPKGDHGGESDLEVDAALFIYKKKPFLTEFFDGDYKLPLDKPAGNFSKAIWSNFHDKLQKRDVGQLETIPLYDSRYPSVYQIDLVPTIAGLLNIDIPFGNLGTFIPQLFFRPLKCKECTPDATINGIMRLLGLLERNLAQFYTYIHEYHYRTGDMEDVMQHIKKMCAQLKMKIIAMDLSSIFSCIERKGVNCKTNELTDDLLEITAEMVYIMRSTLGKCRDVWAKFDTFKMSIAIILMSISVVIVLRKLIGLNTKAVVKFRMDTLLFILLTILQSISQASNSFIIFEDMTIFFLMQSVMFYLFVSQKSRKTRFGLLFALITTRFTSTSTICREEQLPRCQDTFKSMGIFSVIDEHFNDLNLSVPWKSILALLLCSHIAPNGINFWMKLQSKTEYAGKIAIRLVFGCLFCMWLAEAVDERKFLSDYSYMTSTVKLWSPRFALISILYLLYQNLFNKTMPVLNAMTQSCILGFISLIPQLPSGLIMLTLQLLSILALSYSYKHGKSPLYFLIFIYLGMHGFFITGHQATFSSIQFQTGFIGLESFSFFLSGGLVTLNTLGSILVSTFAQKIILAIDGKEDKSLHQMNALLFLFHHSFHSLCSLIFTSILRRHLMVWNVFAPRFMLAAANLLLVEIVYLFASS